MFAEMSPEGWVVVIVAGAGALVNIIAGLAVLVVKVIEMISSVREKDAKLEAELTKEKVLLDRETARLARELELATKVEQVRLDAIEAASKVALKVDTTAETIQTIKAGQDTIGADMLKLEKNTNSIKDALMAKTEEAGILRGGAEERARVAAAGLTPLAKAEEKVETVMGEIKVLQDQVKEVPAETADAVVEKLEEKK